MNTYLVDSTDRVVKSPGDIFIDAIEDASLQCLRRYRPRPNPTGFMAVVVTPMQLLVQATDTRPEYQLLLRRIELLFVEHSLCWNLV